MIFQIERMHFRKENVIVAAVNIDKLLIQTYPYWKQLECILFATLYLFYLERSNHLLVLCPITHFLIMGRKIIIASNIIY